MWCLLKGCAVGLESRLSGSAVSGCSERTGQRHGGREEDLKHWRAEPGGREGVQDGWHRSQGARRRGSASVEQGTHIPASAVGAQWAQPVFLALGPKSQGSEPVHAS